MSGTHRKNPNFTMLHSIKKQITYVGSIANGSEQDKSKLKDLTLGIYAVREFLDTDREFAELLVNVNDIASRLKY